MGQMFKMDMVLLGKFRQKKTVTKNFTISLDKIIKRPRLLMAGKELDGEKIN